MKILLYVNTIPTKKVNLNKLAKKILRKLAQNQEEKKTFYSYLKRSSATKVTVGP